MGHVVCGVVQGDAVAHLACVAGRAGRCRARRRGGSGGGGGGRRARSAGARASAGRVRMHRGSGSRHCSRHLARQVESSTGVGGRDNINVAQLRGGRCVRLCPESASESQTSTWQVCKFIGRLQKGWTGGGGDVWGLTFWADVWGWKGGNNPPILEGGPVKMPPVIPRCHPAD